MDNYNLRQSLSISLLSLGHSHIIVYLMCCRTLLTKLYLVSSICGMSVLRFLSPLSLHLEAVQCSL